jgi:hypothetical protein
MLDFAKLGETFGEINLWSSFRNCAMSQTCDRVRYLVGFSIR